MSKFIKNRFLIVGYLGLVGLLHVNAMLKAEDPIQSTQTEPISYEKKMEQEKDGVKAPASPRVIFYGGQGFLTQKKTVSKTEKMGVSKKTIAKDAFNWSHWWGEKPAALPITAAVDADAQVKSLELALAKSDKKKTARDFLPGENADIANPDVPLDEPDSEPKSGAEKNDWW